MAFSVARPAVRGLAGSTREAAGEKERARGPVFEFWPPTSSLLAPLPSFSLADLSLLLLLLLPHLRCFDSPPLHLD